MAMNMDAVLRIKADVQGQDKVQKLGGALGTLNGTADKTSAGFRGMGSAALAMGAAISSAAVIGAVKNTMDVFGGYQQDIMLLENGLKNLGGTAPQELEKLKEAASELGEVTLFNEEDFNKGFGLLTSFTNIAVKDYERLGMAAADVAQTSGTDVSSAMMQLAKAMNDPIKGLTALGRSGIQFSESQKAMIESMVEAGDIAGAQQLIFAELERQYGGNAAAAAKGYAGAMDTLGEKFFDLKKAIGPVIEAALVPLISALTQVVSFVADRVVPLISALPQPLQVVIGGVAALGVAIAALLPIVALLGPGLIQVGAAISGMGIGATIAGWAGAIGPAMAAISAAFSGLLAFLTGTVLPGLLAFFSGPVGWTVLAVAAVVAMVIAFREPIMNFLSWLWELGEPIRQFWFGLWEGLKGAITAYFNWAMGVFNAAFQTLYAIAWQLWVQPWINLWNNVLREPVTSAWGWLQGIWSGISGWFTKNVTEPIAKAWEAVITALPKALKGAADFIKGIWTGMIEGIKNAIRLMLQFIANQINTVAGLVNRLISGFNRLPGPDIPLIPLITIPQFAAGGVVDQPTVAMVGEGGEREYIIPESKMAAASARYLTGARGAAVVPGGNGGISIGNPQINVTTGPVLQQNGQQYVTIQDLERAMRMTAEGVIGRLRTPSARVALGMG